MIVFSKPMKTSTVESDFSIVTYLNAARRTRMGNELRLAYFMCNRNPDLFVYNNNNADKIEGRSLDVAKMLQYQSNKSIESKFIKMLLANPVEMEEPSLDVLSSPTTKFDSNPIDVSENDVVPRIRTMNGTETTELEGIETNTELNIATPLTRDTDKNCEDNSHKR